jgi:hypothetical protein
MTTGIDFSNLSVRVSFRESTLRVLSALLFAARGAHDRWFERAILLVSDALIGMASENLTEDQCRVVQDIVCRMGSSDREQVREFGKILRKAGFEIVQSDKTRKIFESEGLQPAGSCAEYRIRFIKKVRNLSLGTRIRYIGHDTVWVVLDKTGCGLIAKWEGIYGLVSAQEIRSIVENEADMETLQVEVEE